jgi:putative ABC transport system substrate-binding protein
MRRREFLVLLAAAATASNPGQAQQLDAPVRKIAVLMATREDDLEERSRVGTFQRTLQDLGWPRARFDVRWTANEAERVRAYATELVAHDPDVILAGNTQMVEVLQRATQRIPIVFVQVPESTVRGLVGNLARPTSNATGFANFESSVAGKWVELLKEIAPKSSESGPSCMRGIRPRLDICAQSRPAPSRSVSLSPPSA